MGRLDRRGPADAILCTVDLLKRDAEIKLLIGCSEGEKEAILRFLNANAMRAMLIRRG
jgi:inorganic pyrophosphatase